MKRAIGTVLFFATAFTLLYLSGNKTDVMTDAVRDAAGVNHVTIGGVTTAYEMAGSGTEGTVVLIHGANGPGFVWDENVAALQAAGLRTLRYDIAGRGYSGRYDDAAYDLDFYIAQLHALLQHLAPDAPVHLVGSSMGAIIAAEYAARNPDRVGRVVLVGPAGFPINNFAANFVRVPLLSDYIMHALGDRLILKANIEYFHDPETPDAARFLERAENLMRYRGLKPAMLATMRRMPMQDFADGYARLNAANKRVLLIWGREDKTFAFTHSTRALELMPAAELFPVDNSAHLPMYEQAGAVNGKLVEFLVTR